MRVVRFAARAVATVATIEVVARTIEVLTTKAWSLIPYRYTESEIHDKE